MPRAKFLRYFVAGVVGSVLIVLLVIAIERLTRHEPVASADALQALAAWSAFAQAIATILLVLLAAPTAYVGLTDLRTRRRPIVSVTRTELADGGLRVLLTNVGETGWLSIRLRAWVGYSGPDAPQPSEWASAIEGLAVAIQGGEPAMFEAKLNALGVGQERWELLRWGPRADQYDTGWVAGYGVVIWDAELTDIYQGRHAGSGQTDAEPPLDD